MNYLKYFLSFSLLSLSLTSFAEIPTVSHVELSRYLGHWHEIARFPHSFQKDCAKSEAQYTLLPSGKIEVINSCASLSEPGKELRVRGLAKVVDKKTNAKLKVSFGPWLGWPFAGDYWILDLDENYQYALVGTPDLDYLWILARTPELAAENIEHLIKRAQVLGFDTGRLIFP